MSTGRERANGLLQIAKPPRSGA